jgi:hypothetical protein
MKHKPCRWHRQRKPYGATTNNLPLRTVFPFIQRNIIFNRGYSAEYGEALSSVLLLNTQDEPDQNKTEISLMTVRELEILKNGKVR